MITVSIENSDARLLTTAVNRGGLRSLRGKSCPIEI
jgi:hypothetical protein